MQFEDSTQVHGAKASADANVVARCSCPGGCIVVFDRWDDEDSPEFYGELYTGYHPVGFWQRIKNAVTCLRGREVCAASVVLNEEAATALARLLSGPVRHRPASADPTPDGQKGMFRKRGETLLDHCVYLMEAMFMETLNGSLCQVDAENRCGRCERLWDDLRALMGRYDAGER